MTSTVCAQPLEEAIKGVDVSGMLRYRYDDTNNDTATNKASTQTNEYKMDLNIASKVNDMVTANVKIEALGVNTTALDTAFGTDNTEQAHTTSDTTGDRDVNLVVSKANFSANLGFATVIAGKQSVPTPMVDNSVDDVTRGTGAVALVPAGPVTIAAGYFNNIQRAETTTNLGQNTTAVGVLGKVADVSFDAWMADIDGVRSGTSIGANASFAGVNIDARHTSVDQDAATAADADLTKIVASTKIGGATLVAGFATTSKVSATQTVAGSGVSLDADNDAKSDFKVWQASVGALSDATAFLIGAGMDVMPNLNLDAKYVTVDFGTASEAASELLLQATYKMSKNFGLNVRYSMYEVDNTAGVATTDSTKGRLELKYTF
jgi:hypothetical protein